MKDCRDFEAAHFMQRCIIKRDVQARQLLHAPNDLATSL